MRLFRLLTLRDVPPRLRLLCFGSLGVMVGMGIYVARISEATSYLSDDPKACINCHIMAPEYATWQHSSHARVTNCNDCHVPHDSTVAKYLYKAKDGMRHSLLFTLRREPQVMQTIPASRKVIQQNCVRCHSQLVSEVATGVHADPARACIDCHREVPHGRVHSLSATPNAAIPQLTSITPEWLDNASKKREDKR